ncbi:MAG: hypothetical protein A2020_10785 [Lentisphaerae bacterium GWF2_45_14]|nr:MAG: hypothetical protein A2020_10785 [Lentisphaerae bacterium GWF2_45_14]
MKPIFLICTQIQFNFHCLLIQVRFEADAPFFGKKEGLKFENDTALDVELLNAPESVDFTIRKNLDSGETIFHLIQLYGRHVKTLKEIKKERSLRKDCTLASESGVIVLPELDDFDVIAVETQP